MKTATNHVDIEVAEPLALLLTKPKRIKIAVGGRGSSKSTGVADIMLMFAGMGQRICCAREFQNSIDDSVHENLKVEIDRLNMVGFDVKESRIRSCSGGELFYKGLARNITSMKSLAGVDKLWIEEGESISDKSLKVLTPSIRSSAASNSEDGEPPEIWVTMNRGSSKDAIAKKYLSRAEKELSRCGYYEDDLIMVVEVNWRDNPWFPPELEQERQDDFENLPRAEYDHIWESAYGDSIENAIIFPEWFDACVDAHIKLGFPAVGQERVAYDPADTGDAKALAYSVGSVVKAVHETHEGRIDEATDWATSLTIEYRPDTFTWDEDGMGTGLKRQIQLALNGKRILYEGFSGGGGCDNPDAPYEYDSTHENKKKIKTNRAVYANRRAQYYWILRERMRATYRAITNPESRYVNPENLISLSSEIEDLQSLRAELCRIPRKYVASGKIQILSKSEMKKLEIDSPNMGDAVMMLGRAIVSAPAARRSAQEEPVGMGGWT